MASLLAVVPEIQRRRCRKNDDPLVVPSRGEARKTLVSETLAEKPRRPTRLAMKHECRRRSRLAQICLICRKSTFSARV